AGASESEPADFFNSPRVHWMRNALAHVPKAQQPMAAAALRQAFLQPDQDMGRVLTNSKTPQLNLSECIKKYIRLSKKNR
ncbi:MAG: hypothetical protein ACOYNP_17135, partial [Gemmataceae bacterium]